MGKHDVKLLTDAAIRRMVVPAYYRDGGGLHLQVSRSGTRSWIFRFTLSGKVREMGLGPYPDVSLAEARQNASDRRRDLREGIDPIEARNSKRTAERREVAKALIFSDCAARYIEAKRPEWKNAKHADQWENTLATYAYPVFGSLPVASVDTALVMLALEPIWTTKTETASRLRGRIESVLDWATVRGYRQGENPARWKGHLDTLLAKPSKVAKVAHHPALPYIETAEFVQALRKQEGTAARALEFLILTATRTNEVIGARWGEIDTQAGIWTIPAERMKMAKEHRAPLTARALEILKDMEAVKTSEWVFPGGRTGQPLSNMAMLALLKRMERHDLTAHGFRSTFRDWAAETTNYPREVAEMALAHAVENKVEGAYRRGDLCEKRRRMMEEWAKYCGAVMVPGEVVPIRKGNPTA